MSNIDLLYKKLENMPSFYREMLLGIPFENMSVTTKLKYAGDVYQFFAYLHKQNAYFGEKEITEYALSDISKISPLDANEYMIYLLEHHKGKTVSREIAAVSSMYKELMRFEKVKSNPFSLLKRPKEKEHVIIHLTEREKENFLRVIRTGEGQTKKELSYHDPKRDLAIFTLFLNTGLRVSELAGINIKDVDFEECQIIVKRKGGKVTSVYFSDKTADILEDYLESREETSIEAPLFVHKNGNRLSIRCIERLCDKYTRLAGINKRITPHKMRSTFAMDFYEKTGDVLLLKEMMGHKNIVTTTVYAEATDLRKKEARNVLD